MTSSTDLTAPPGSVQSEPAPAPALTVAKKTPYRAFERSTEEKRYLEIRLKFPESAECLSNAMLTNIRAEWRMGLYITLEYGNPQKLDMMVTIKGENLIELYQALKAWKVESIAEFNPVDYEQPTDDTAPFIKSITVHTTRPETPPPVEKRH